MDQNTSASRQRLVLDLAIAPSVTTVVFFLPDHVLRGESWSWLDGVVLFTGMFLVSLAGPSVRRFFRGPNGE